MRQSDVANSQPASGAVTVCMVSADPDLDGFELYAYIGEDELGSGALGLKQGFAPGGLTALVATAATPLLHPNYLAQIEAQAARFGKPIRLVRLVYAETLDRFDGT